MKVLLITNYLIKSTLNKRKALALYLLLPMLCLLLPLFVLSAPEKNKGKISISIVDMDNSQQSKNFINDLKEKYNFNLYPSDINSARESLISDKTCLIICIPSNFQQDLLSNKHPQVELIYLKEKEEIPAIKNVVNSYLTNLNLLVAADKLDFNSTFSPSIQFINKDEASSSSNILETSVGLMILFMIVLVNTSFTGFLTDKKNNNLSRVVRTGLTPSHYLSSYILFSALLCCFQCGFLILLTKFFNITLEFSNGALVFIFALISAVAIAIGAFSITFCKNEDEISILNAVIVFPTCMLSGCLWPIEIMSNFFQKLSLIFPQRHILILMKFLQGEINYTGIIIESLLILLICTLFITLSFMRINSKGWKTYI